MAVATEGFGSIIAALTEAGGGTAASKDVGVDAGNVVELVDVGEGVVGLPAVDGSLLTGIVAGGVGDLLAENNLSDLDDVGEAIQNLGLGSSALLDAGVAVGDVVQLIDLGEGLVGLPAVDGSQLTGIGDLFAANNLSDLEDVDEARVNLRAPQVYVAEGDTPNENNDEVDTAELGRVFQVGDLWVDTQSQALYVCVYAEPEEAEWVSLTRGVKTYSKTGDDLLYNLQPGDPIDVTAGEWFNVGMVHRLRIVSSASLSLNLEFRSAGDGDLLYQVLGVDAFTEPYEDVVPWHCRDDGAMGQMYFRLTNTGAVASDFTIHLYGMGE